MTGTHDPARPGDSMPGALTVDLLARLHAGVLDKAAASRLRNRVATDPQAQTVLAALDATVADLAALPTRQPERMPDAVAHRLDAALIAEGQRADRHWLPAAGEAPPGPAVPVATLPAWRRRRVRRIGAGVLAVAAAMMGIALSGVQLTPPAPRADDALGAAAVPPAPLTLASGNLGSALNRTLGARNYGALSRPETLRRCLDANGVAVPHEPLGAHEVILDGRRGVMLVLPTGRIDEVRLLVVGPDCGRRGPSRMADTVVPHH